jgi:hypothetical protein
MFFYHHIESRTWHKDFQFCFILVELRPHLVHWKSAGRFLTIYEDSIGSIVQPWEMAYHIRALREQNEVLIFSLPHKNFYSAQSVDVPNALNDVNLALISVKKIKDHFLLS